jgi:hypothetical protein
MLYKEDNTGDPRVRPSGSEASGLGVVLDYIRDTYAERMSLLTSVNLKSLRMIQTKGLGPQSVWAYVLVRASEKDPIMAEKFIDYFAGYGEVSPFSKNLYLCAERIFAARKEAEDSERGISKGQHQNFVSDVLEAIVVAWNLTREGTHLRATGAFTKKVNDLVSWPSFK